MKKFLIFLAVFSSFIMLSQEEQYKVFPEPDSLYREDQFYIGATFHVIRDLPENVSQSGFSGGLHAGFIRDIPFNKRRNWALGLGLGYSVNTYNHNLRLTGNPEMKYQEIPNLDDIETNRFTTHLVEAPIEIRWRTSTPTDYKFWRIYAGLRLGYMHFFRSTFEDNNGFTQKIKSPDSLDRLRLGTTLTFGWNTFNFHIYYSVKSFFKKTDFVIDQQGAFAVFKLGLMFYVL